MHPLLKAVMYILELYNYYEEFYSIKKEKNNVGRPTKSRILLSKPNLVTIPLYQPDNAHTPRSASIRRHYTYYTFVITAGAISLHTAGATAAPKTPES